MELLDPTTGEKLSSDAIQRVLFIASKVHVYKVPPLTSIKGHSAASWTEDASRHIFEARLRVIETSEASVGVKVDVVLEDPTTGQLFAAAPYRDRSDVEAAVDSTRFFALTVRDNQDRKAVLGIGFEERSDAFDLSVSLQEAGRSLGLPESSAAGGAKKDNDDGAMRARRDYSLKEGETITVNLGSTKFGRRRPQDSSGDGGGVDAATGLQSFDLPPPPTTGGFALPPPPKASDVKLKRRSLRDMGFDDGKFGEFA